MHFDLFRMRTESLSTFTKRLEKIRLEEVVMWMTAPYAFSPWFSSRANTTILLRSDSTTNGCFSGAPWWLQMELAARLFDLQNCLQVKQRNNYQSLNNLHGYT